MSNRDYGYRRSSTERLDNDWRDGDGAGMPDNWPENNWPDWPDNSLPAIDEHYGSDNGSSRELSADDNWAPKWPRVSRPNDKWPGDDWEDENWRDDRWQDTRWPEPRWPESRRAAPWPDSSNEPEEAVTNTHAP